MMNEIKRETVFHRLIFDRETGKPTGESTTEGAQKPTKCSLFWWPSTPEDDTFELSIEGDVVVESDIPYEYGVFDFGLTKDEAMLLYLDLRTFLGL